MKEIFTLFIYWTFSGIFMTDYKLDVIPEYASDAVINFNSHSLAGYEFQGLFNKLALFKSSDLGSLASGSVSPAVDAFGRQRVSDVYTLGDYKHLYSINNDFVDFTTASADIQHDVNQSLVTLSTGAASSSRAVHQTKMYHNYMPGKSQMILSSFVFGAAQAGITKRTGYFDDYNGIFLEQDSTGSLQIVLRTATSGTGSLQETRVKQENWNINKLLSGDFTLDVTKTQLFYIDFQWLAVGRVRCGFVYKGNTIICHTFDHTNILSIPYMSNPNLPVRCEIFNTGTEVGSMKQICSTVGSEGGYAESGVAWELSSPSLRTITASATMPVMAIRLKNSYGGLQNRAFVRLEQVAAFTEDQTARYNLVKIPNSSSLIGGSWVSVNDDSFVEYNVTATSYTTGSTFLGGFIFAGGVGGGNNIAGQQQTPAPNAKGNYIAQNFQSNDSEIYALVMKNMTGTSTDVGCSITWKEVV
jgi:hypothetical protein